LGNTTVFLIKAYDIKAHAGENPHRDYRHTSIMSSNGPIKAYAVHEKNYNCFGTAINPA
jgi:hypothetical protein